MSEPCIDCGHSVTVHAFNRTWDCQECDCARDDGPEHDTEVESLRLELADQVAGYRRLLKDLGEERENWRASEEHLRAELAQVRAGHADEYRIWVKTMDTAVDEVQARLEQAEQALERLCKADERDIGPKYFGQTVRLYNDTHPFHSAKCSHAARIAALFVARCALVPVREDA